MADFKSMYYHLAGRTATAVDVLEATTSIMQANAKAAMSIAESMQANAKASMATAEAMQANAESMKANAESMMDSVNALIILKEKLKLAQQTTEDMFINCEDDDLD